MQSLVVDIFDKSESYKDSIKHTFAFNISPLKIQREKTFHSIFASLSPSSDVKMNTFNNQVILTTKLSLNFQVEKIPFFCSFGEHSFDCLHPFLQHFLIYLNNRSIKWSTIMGEVTAYKLLRKSKYLVKINEVTKIVKLNFLALRKHYSKPKRLLGR